MKKTVRVITEQEFVIDIPDYQLTHEHIALFERGIFELDGDDFEDKVLAYFEFAGRMAAKDYPEVDGLGDIGPEYMRDRAKDKNYFVSVEETYNDVETEIINE